MLHFKFVVFSSTPPSFGTSTTLYNFYCNQATKGPKLNKSCPSMHCFNDGVEVVVVERLKNRSSSFEFKKCLRPSLLLPLAFSSSDDLSVPGTDILSTTEMTLLSESLLRALIGPGPSCFPSSISPLPFVENKIYLQKFASDFG